MKKHACFIFSLLFFLPISIFGQDAAEPVWERPNIVWIVAEDLGPYIPSFGDSTIETPGRTCPTARVVNHAFISVNVRMSGEVNSPINAVHICNILPGKLVQKRRCVTDGAKV